MDRKIIVALFIKTLEKNIEASSSRQYRKITSRIRPDQCRAVTTADLLKVSGRCWP